MINKVTGFTSQKKDEGDMIFLTFSTINENGEIINSNQRKSYVVVNNEILNHITAIKTFYENQINGGELLNG